MRDVLPTLQKWQAAGQRFATATVVQTWGSSPRPVGAVMGVREDGVVVGSVSGGCVEPAVMEAALGSLVSGSSVLLDFGPLSDESVWAIGLSCGGRIRVLVTPEPYRSDAWRQTMVTLSEGQPTVLIRRIGIATTSGATDIEVPPESDGGARYPTLQDTRESHTFEADGVEYFAQVIPAPDRLIIVGAVHIAIPLIKFAHELGFETIVIDPRPALMDSERFPIPPGRKITAWPAEALEQVAVNANTYAAVLTHDPKIDDVALEVLLRSPAAYVGALGSRVTQQKRRTQLLDKGFCQSDLERIHGPIGLSIGSRSPEEIALSIMAEIVQVRNANR